MHLVETMAYAGELPWHGLGTKVLPNLTPKEMLEQAGLDWTVEKHPAHIQLNGEWVSIGSEALVRSSDQSVLSVVSDDWEPVQNHQAFEFFDEFVNAGDMEMHTAGSLKNGKMVWALAKINDGFTVFGDDRVESYLLFSNPHEYGRAVDVRFTPIRVVCNNTLTLAINEINDRSVRVTHRGEFDASVVKRCLGVAQTKLKTYKEAAEFLGSKRYDEQNLIRYLREVYPKAGDKTMNEDEEIDASSISRNASRVFKMVENQPGHEFAPGSWWNAFNAVTYFTDHEAGRKTDTRLTSSWYGNGRGLKIRALDKAVEYAKAA